MTDELNKAEEYSAKKTALPTASETMAKEKLKALAGLISETDKNAESRKGAREKLAAESEINKERRLDETRGIMEENSERARAVAIERVTSLEYGAEYRKIIIARENKKAAERKARLEAEEKEADILRENERKSEIDAFIEKEREELKARSLLTKRIFEEISKEEAPLQTEETEETEAQHEVRSRIEEEEEVIPHGEAACEELPESRIQNEKCDTDESLTTDNEETDRIILNINPGINKQSAEMPKPENFIHIPALYFNPQVDVNDDLRNPRNLGMRDSGAQDSVEFRGREYPELSYESTYRDYYKEAEELYNRELLDEYGKHLVQKDGVPYNPDDAAMYPEESLLSLSDTSYDASYMEGQEDIGIGIDRKNASEDDIGGFAKVELSKRLSAYHKQESILKSNLKKIESKQKNTSYAENVRLTVEKIGVHKEIVEVAIEALRACVYVGSRVNISKHRRFLEKEIFRYNSAVGEYETLTGRQLTKLSSKMAADIEQGRICQPIPNVYYVNDWHNQPESVNYYEPRVQNEASYMAEQVDAPSLDDEDYDSDFGEAREREKIFAKERAKKVNEIRRLSERDVLLVVLRNEYKLSKYETEYHMLQHTFSIKRKQKAKKMQKLDRRISKIRNNLRRSLKLERDDNRRYYYLFTVDPMKERVKKEARREELDALKLRLEVLLREREEINERIIALYGGSDKNLRKIKIDRKATGVRKKIVKMMYRRQERIAARVQRMKAPEDLKEKFFAILNKKTEKVGVLEEQIYKLKKGRLKGKARRELEREVRRAKSSIKYIDSDMKYIMKKLKRHQERYEDDRAWAITLIVFSLLAIAGVACWYFFGESIKAYFADIISKFHFYIN